jgi:hypothetical protein
MVSYTKEFKKSRGVQGENELYEPSPVNVFHIQ